MIQTELSLALRWRGGLYGPGPATIPDDLAAVLGIQSNQKPAPPTPEPNPAPEHEQASAPAALALINSSDRPRSLIPIPTIGNGAGTIILRDRPEDGYPSLDDLPDEIFEPPYNCDREQIQSWEG